MCYQNRSTASAIDSESLATTRFPDGGRHGQPLGDLRGIADRDAAGPRNVRWTPVIRDRDVYRVNGGHAAIAAPRVCTISFIHTHTRSGRPPKRTNIDIDDALMAKAQRVSGQATKKQQLKEALRLMIRLRRQRGGRTRPSANAVWRGSLARSRTGTRRRMIVVDSSVWIDFFRGRKDATCQASVRHPWNGGDRPRGSDALRGTARSRE